MYRGEGETAQFQQGKIGGVGGNYERDGGEWKVEFNSSSDLRVSVPYECLSKDGMEGQNEYHIESAFRRAAEDTNTHQRAFRETSRERAVGGPATSPLKISLIHIPLLFTHQCLLPKP
jgi:hypothetical protein